jgi:dTDP-4-dehydrorhamnose 3,5-epimerase
MNVSPTALPGVLLIEPRVFADARGAFFESWNEARYAPHFGGLAFVQDNFSISASGVVRGLHFQHPYGQGKLVSVPHGSAFDVAVDVRVGSQAFGRWVGVTLSAANRHQLWIPPGFAHGYQALEDGTVFHYKCTAPYQPESEVTVRFDDPAIGIAWPLGERVASLRDAQAHLLAAVPAERLPTLP